MRILAIDFGEKRLGFAICDPLGITAQSLDNYTRMGEARDEEYIKKILKDYSVDTVLLGWPRNMDGSEGVLCQKVAQFALWIEGFTDIRLDYYDERLSSAQAEKTLIAADVSRKKRKGLVDKMSAAIVLDDYLQSGLYNIRRELPWKKDTLLS